MMTLPEESCILMSQSQPQLALEKSKLSQQKEQQAIQIRAQILQLNSTNPISPQNLDLSYFVGVQLAVSYTACKMYTEAIAAYSVIIKNKLHVNGERLRVNVGGVLMEQLKYGAALNMYRMAMDQLPSTQKSLKFVITMRV